MVRMDFNLYQPSKQVFSWRSRKNNLLFLVVFLAVGFFLLTNNDKKSFDNKTDNEYLIIPNIPLEEDDDMSKNTPEKEEWRFISGPIDMNLVKKNGCIADGFLSGYGEKSDEIADMLSRSKCVYLHRALETWLRPPNFEKAREIMQKMEENKRPLIYGMFLAEAISTRRDYEDPDWDHEFEFKKMCRNENYNQWEKNSCIPSINKPEYRRYLKSITHRAMDLGIQSFMFGQMELQDPNPNFEETEVKIILDDMRAYAKEKDMQIIIGAQTNDIIDERYLRLFDYIEGGMGIDDDGNLENDACWSGMSSCWALLWHEKYRTKANNVLLHLDWSGLTWDDMGKFARMDQKKRIETLDTLYRKFTKENMGFMMPFLAVLHRENGGCYGPNKNFYTPSKKYRCDDEQYINNIMPEVKK